MSHDAPTYVVVGSKLWNRAAFDDLQDVPGDWHYIDRRSELTLDGLRAMSARRVFFVHWSWRVPDSVVAEFECINFHMTDLPYGRGGSPLQNLIVAGHRTTKLTAHRMTSDVDAGPIYLQEELALDGTAEEIYVRATQLATRMIRRIIAEDPAPTEQVGEVVEFRRRTPDEGRIDGLGNLDSVYDHIRMLDAEGYPSAFLETGVLRIEFRRAARYDRKIVADAVITLQGDTS